MSITFEVSVDKFCQNVSLDKKWLDLAKVNINEDEDKRKVEKKEISFSLILS